MPIGYYTGLNYNQRDPRKKTLIQPSNTTFRDILGVTPVVGDAIALQDAKRAVDEGNYGQAAFNMLGFLPFVPAAITKYHASPNLFDKFKPSTWRGGSYFADTPESAISGAKAGGNEPIVGHSGKLKYLYDVDVPENVYGAADLPEWFLPKKVTYGDYKKYLSGEKKFPDPDIKGLTKAQKKYINDQRLLKLREYEEGIPESEWHKYAEDDLPLVAPKGGLRGEPVSYQDIEGFEANPFAPSGSIRNEETRDLFRKMGYKGALVADEAGTSTLIFDPDDLKILKRGLLNAGGTTN